MANFELTGSIIALATPFLENGKVDYAAFDRMLDFYASNGTAGVVVCGTSGETPTLTEEEDAEMFAHTVKKVAGRMKVIAGTGSNCTAECIKYTGTAKAAGVDAVLVVGPYYNKPSQKGMYEHFAAVAEAVDVPIIMYNVPGRTGSKINVETTLALAEKYPNIVGIKEASGNIASIEALVAGRKPGFKIYSGDDATSMVSNLLGADGCISVAAGVIPADFAAMMKYSLEGNLEKALELHYKYRNLFSLLFIESNPIPVKAALAEMGMIKEVYRLPLCPMAPENKAKLVAEMKNLGILK